MGPWRLKPSQRIGLGALLALLAVAAMLVTALAGLGDTGRRTRTLIDETVPAGAAIDRVIDSQVLGQDLFERAMQEGDPAVFADLISTADEANRVSQTSWHAFRMLVPSPSAAERRLLQQREDLNDAAVSGAAAVVAVDRLADPGAFAAAIARQRAVYDEHVAVLRELKDRYVAGALAEALPASADAVDGTRRALLIVFGSVLVLGAAIAVHMLRQTRAEECRQARIERDRARDAHLGEIETQVQRGFEMKPTEDGVYDVLEKALGLVAPELSTELLVADSSRAHFRQVASNVSASPPACPVGSPADCPATSSGQARVFPDSRRVDACGYLDARPEGPVWASCVPVSIAGRAIGVIHSAAPVDPAPEPAVVQAIELVARKLGDRLGVLRVLAKTETQAQVDVLTGLPNRRTVENAAHVLVADDQQFCVAFADIDHFKLLNDAHGHETGDRALRLFARVLRDSVRPSDMPARFGGEEFVTLLPDCTVGDAATVAARLQARLEDALEAASVPPFTVSVGIASRDPGEVFSEVVAHADEALLYAKGHGRNRVVTTEDFAAPHVSQPPIADPTPAGASGSSRGIADSVQPHVMR